MLLKIHSTLYLNPVSPLQPAAFSEPDLYLAGEGEEKERG
jgi:hypothetical protein